MNFRCSYVLYIKNIYVENIRLAQQNPENDFQMRELQSFCCVLHFCFLSFHFRLHRFFVYCVEAIIIIILVLQNIVREFVEPYVKHHFVIVLCTIFILQPKKRKIQMNGIIFNGIFVMFSFPFIHFSHNQRMVFPIFCFLFCQKAIIFMKMLAFFFVGLFIVFSIFSEYIFGSFCFFFPSQSCVNC